MFRLDDKVIVPEPTPERVYQCALYLQNHNKGITRADFKKAMAMPEIFEDKGEKIFDTTYGVLKELELCMENDGKIFPSEALLVIKSVHDFRRHCARTVFQAEGSLFFNVTSMYSEFAADMMKARKWDDVNLFMGQHGLQIHPNVLKGWRLWAPFLGCGYLNDYFMIPNWAQRIADLLEDQQEFQPNEEYPIEQFMNWLMAKAPEIKSSIKGREIGLGISNGLRTLDELGILKIIHTPDASQWQLVATSGSNVISYVKIVR